MRVAPPDSGTSARLGRTLARLAASAATWLVLVSPPSFGGAFEDGIKAYDAKDYAAALALWTPLAEQGRAAAQFNLGFMYEKGQGVAKDLAEAARWYLKAGEQGDTEAQLKVATLYESGSGIPQDMEKARAWYRRVLADARTDAATQDAKRRALEKLRALPPPPGEAEEVFAFEGGRFVLRRAAGGACVVALQGTITKDTSTKFGDLVRKADAAGCAKPWMLLLESPGGLLAAGVELGEQARAQKVTTVARYSCASACSLIFLGGVERVLWGSRAAIGFHQPRSRSDRQCETFGISLDVFFMKKYLHEVVPASADRIVDIIMNTSCDSIEWKRGRQAIELGIATRIEAEGVDAFGPEASRRAKQ